MAATEASGLGVLAASSSKLFQGGRAIEQGDRVVDKAWELGDLLWTKYDEKF